MTLLVPTRRKPSRLAFTFSAGLLALSLVALPSFAQDTPPQVPAAAVEAPAAQAPVLLSPDNLPAARQGDAGPPPDATMAAMTGSAGDSEDTSKPRWYGPKPGEEQTAALPPGAPQPLLPHGAQEGQPQSVTAALPGNDVHSLYEKGYGALSQNDYAGAEAAFSQLIDTYPKDPLAGNAQYWNGESYYHRGQHKNAADAFLKGYKKYKSGDKAPETLLKLGMSLAALGPRRPARLSASSRPNFQRHLRPSATKPRPSRRRPAADT